MGTYVLMKILESSPSRYDKGIHILTLGRLNKVYEHLTSYIRRGEKVLDIGCGTGILTLKAAQKGAKVKGIDINPQMLGIAQKRVNEGGLTQNVELLEMGVAELGSEESETYDIIMSCLCFSELTEDEIVYTLREVERILKPGGLLLIADEMRPKAILKRILNQMIRIPLLIVTYLATQTTIKGVKDLPKRIKESGLRIESIKLNRRENFIEVIARKPKE